MINVFKTTITFMYIKTHNPKEDAIGVSLSSDLGVSKGYEIKALGRTLSDIKEREALKMILDQSKLITNRCQTDKAEIVSDRMVAYDCRKMTFQFPFKKGMADDLQPYLKL